MGSITLGLREVVVAARETIINAKAILGEIKIIIAPAHMHALVDGTPIMGDCGGQGQGAGWPRPRLADHPGREWP